MTIFMNPGDCKSAETPVIPTFKVEETVLSKNKDTDDDDDTDDTDESESNRTPPNTPSLMKEIGDVIAREEMG